MKKRSVKMAEKQKAKLDKVSSTLEHLSQPESEEEEGESDDEV